MPFSSKVLSLDIELNLLADSNAVWMNSSHVPVVGGQGVRDLHEKIYIYLYLYLDLAVDVDRYEYRHRYVCMYVCIALKSIYYYSYGYVCKVDHLGLHNLSEDWAQRRLIIILPVAIYHL